MHIVPDTGDSLRLSLDVCSHACPYPQDGLKSDEGPGGADEEMAEADEAVKAAEEGGKVCEACQL
jgi:hypothetical protein